MDQDTNYLDLDDQALRAQCDVHIYKSSGPGGQHRNKVSSAVRFRHRPTGVTAHSDESRSQHDNRRIAMRQLRMKLACHCRRPLPPHAELPPLVADCLFTPRGRQAGTLKRLAVGRKDHRFWPVAAFLLDLPDAHEGSLGDAAASVGVSTANLAKLLKSDRHLLAAAQRIRNDHGHKPIT